MQVFRGGGVTLSKVLSKNEFALTPISRGANPESCPLDHPWIARQSHAIYGNNHDFGQYDSWYVLQGCLHIGMKECLGQTACSSRQSTKTFFTSSASSNWMSSGKVIKEGLLNIFNEIWQFWFALIWMYAKESILGEATCLAEYRYFQWIWSGRKQKSQLAKSPLLWRWGVFRFPSESCPPYGRIYSKRNYVLRLCEEHSYF